MGEKKKFNYSLDVAVVQCAAFMHQHLEAPKAFKDYDIVQSYMDDHQWEIHLRPNYQPDKLVSFYREIDKGYIEFAVFEVKSKMNVIF